jgi:hypothetical protein
VENKTASERRKLWRERRELAAGEGVHLPTTVELLIGSPFLSLSMMKDCQCWCERVVTRRPDLECLLTVLCQDTVTSGDFIAVADAIADLDCEKDRNVAEQNELYTLRARYYAAVLGDKQSAWHVAARIAAWCATDQTEDYLTHTDEIRRALRNALGWLVLSSGKHVRWTNERPAHKVDRQQREVPSYGKVLVELLQKERVEQRDTIEAVRNPFQKPEQDPGPPDGILVFTSLGNGETFEGKRAAEILKNVLGVRLPRVENLGDVAAICSDLAAEFPYAGDVVSVLLTEISPKSYIQFRPTLLVGPPGCGKSRFATRLFEELSIDAEFYPCGGVGDSSFMGTARRWSSGEFSLPASLMLARRTATIGIVLDELDKAGSSTHNGRLQDVLLSMLEPSTAATWHDPYVEGPVDMSHVCWLATANSIDGLSRPLLDRFRVIRFPAPGPEHLEALAATLMRSAVKDSGLHERWATPLAVDEIDALRTAWTGGSVRRLRRLVDGVLAARDLSAARC